MYENQVPDTDTRGAPHYPCRSTAHRRMYVFPTTGPGRNDIAADTYANGDSYTDNGHGPCSDHGHPGPVPTSTPDETQKAVSIKNLEFGPKDIFVKAGTTVTWKNMDALPHTVTSKTPSPVAFDSGRMEQGADVCSHLYPAGKVLLFLHASYVHDGNRDGYTLINAFFNKTGSTGWAL